MKAIMFVGNIPSGTTIAQLKNIFLQFGPLGEKSVDLKGTSAFIHFEKRTDMEKALSGGPYLVTGEQLKCEESSELSRSPSTVYFKRRCIYNVPYVVWVLPLPDDTRHSGELLPRVYLGATIFFLFFCNLCCTETFTPNHTKASSFLGNIAEPIKRWTSK